MMRAHLVFVRIRIYVRERVWQIAIGILCRKDGQIVNGLISVQSALQSKWVCHSCTHTYINVRILLQNIQCFNGMAIGSARKSGE